MTLFLSGCSHQCEDFNTEIMRWIPYKLNDKITLTGNSGSNTLTVTKSEGYHTNKVRYRTDCSCENSYYVTLSSESLFIDFTFYDANSPEISDINIQGELLTSSEYLESLEVNGHVYNDVLIYENLNRSSSHNFERILVSKSIGIILIIKTDEELNIDDISVKQIELSDIKLQTSSC
jgi:hypothetical protein